MVGNCDKFYKVRGGDNCDKISSAHGITLNEFLAWNPEVGGTSCAGLWLNAYVCVSTLGHKASPTEPERPDKPSPTQQGLVENCNKFYLVGKGDTCSRIAAKQGIALSDFVQWNPSVGSNCRSLFSQYYVCVGAPGTRKLEPPSTVPSPVQPGISKACSQYYQAVPGDTCQVIADRFKIPEENLYVPLYSAFNLLASLTILIVSIAISGTLLSRMVGTSIALSWVKHRINNWLSYRLHRALGGLLLLRQHPSGISCKGLLP